MKYIGLQEQITRNNRKSIALLLSFPLLILGSIYIFVLLLYGSSMKANIILFGIVPYVLIGICLWFYIAFLSHTKIIEKATNSFTLDRKENPRIYNIAENLCMGVGMEMPRLCVINSTACNAFASGLTRKTYTVTVTQGLMDTLTDEELEGVIAHELSHIRNKDVRLLVFSVIFVGILHFISRAITSLMFILGSFFSAVYFGRSQKKDEGKGKLALLPLFAISFFVLILAKIVFATTYFISVLLKFLLSRKREYLADSGAAQMTQNPLALASALRKISVNHSVEKVSATNICEMFIENQSNYFSGFLRVFNSLYATHPPMAQRIALLEQF